MAEQQEGPRTVHVLADNGARAQTRSPKGPVVSQTTKRPLAIGQSIPCEAGRFTVTLDLYEPLRVRLEVRHGGSSQTVYGLTRSFPPARESLARDLGRVICKALADPERGTVAAARDAAATLVAERISRLDGADPRSPSEAVYLFELLAGFQGGPLDVRTLSEVRASRTAVA